MWAGGAGLPLLHGCGKANDAGSEVSEAELREWEDGQEAEELGSGGTTTVLAHA